MNIIGIDLGTTNSLGACFIDGNPTLIPNVHNETLTPSVVSVDEEGEVFVGKIAKARLITHPHLTASVFKRNMGSKKQYTLGDKTFTPEDLSSLVIKRIKEDAELFLGEPVEEAIISVPAYFNDVQRRATVLAGELAGLKVERIVNEPTAASIAYGFHEERDFAKFLIFDLGGGTFDVSILEKYNNIMEVRAVTGDIFLGGEDFTDILVEIFLDETKLNQNNLTEKELGVLRRSAEIAKRAFSEKSLVEMTCVLGEEQYSAKIAASKYTERCEDLLSKLRSSVKNAMNDANLSLKDIDNIILVGGATKLPIVRNFVGKLFGRFPSFDINPDEVVAMGTAVCAALKTRSRDIKEMVLTDVCPFTLGMESAIQQPNGLIYYDIYTPIIERNSVVPISRVERFYTLRDNQSDIHCKIYQGESRKASENLFLGELTLSVPKNSAGNESVDVRFTHDINGILEVEVLSVSTGEKKSIVIEKNPGTFSEKEIEEKLAVLKDLKIHPREKEEYSFLLARGERLYEETLGDLRQYLAKELMDFEIVLNSQDERRIRDYCVIFREKLDEIERGKNL